MSKRPSVIAILALIVSAPAFAGSITLGVSSASTGPLTVSAKISDANVATVLAWCDAKSAELAVIGMGPNPKPPPPLTPQECFNNVAAAFAAELIGKVHEWQKTVAAKAATDKIAPIAIDPTPAQ